jgi:hypothetical protein
MSDSINPTPHLNREKVRQTALEIAQAKFGGKKKRVGLSFLQRIDDLTIAAIRQQVSIQSHAGKTLL